MGRKALGERLGLVSPGGPKPRSAHICKEETRNESREDPEQRVALGGRPGGPGLTGGCRAQGESSCVSLPVFRLLSRNPHPTAQAPSSTFDTESSRSRGSVESKPLGTRQHGVQNENTRARARLAGVRIPAPPLALLCPQAIPSWAEGFHVCEMGLAPGSQGRLLIRRGADCHHYY